MKKQPPLSHEKMRELLTLSKSGDVVARKEMIEHNTKLVWSIVQRFSNRGADLDDLFQIGCIGLVKSVDKFDLSYDVKFSTYAVPMIIGEIQRYLRDDSTLKVSRSIRETTLKIKYEMERFSKQHERYPTVHELASALDTKPEDIVLAFDALRDPASLHEQILDGDDGITLMDQMRDDRAEKPFHYYFLTELIERLEPREQLLIRMRFYSDFTQTEVAARLGVSQVQVSRMEKRILERLRGWIPASYV
ncbi:SigF/SigG family RNA polymerase sporulation sigma factor [Chryseomicrobium sp. FSL W7-1435]|uniref:SigF/SigG family RNA polymerase sporulation sigma factor n=1 Tax=Chryseomicrobium sp. FSL W7-1435 TaxID=2921704 RepID=UPI00315A12DA